MPRANGKKIREQDKGSYCKPSLPPGGSGHSTAMIKNPLPSPFARVVKTSIRSFAKKTHTYIVQDCPNHGTVPLNVQPPTPIFVLNHQR